MSLLQSCSDVVTLELMSRLCMLFLNSNVVTPSSDVATYHLMSRHSSTDVVILNLVFHFFQPMS